MLTIDEAAKVLHSKLKQKFADENEEINVIEAAVEIFGNSSIRDKKHKNCWQIKVIRDVIDNPTFCLHHYRIWDWVGLKLVKAFEENG
jgi:hypothetical protein